MKKVYLFLADGFEEIEGLTVVDLLRRAQIQIETVSVKSGDKEIRGSHNIVVKADLLWEETEFEDADMIVLPGGGPGTANLEDFQPLRELVTRFAREGREVAAICAAPRILGSLGLLQGRKATCYPTEMGRLTGALLTEDAVAVDKNLTTSRGLGTAIDFSLALIAKLEGEEKSAQIARSIVYHP